MNFYIFKIEHCPECRMQKRDLF